MGSSNQEPGVSLRTDGWLPKPVDSLMQIPDKIQSSLKMGGVGGIKAQMPSEKVRGSCSTAATAGICLERQLQAWRDDSSWTDQPPEIKVTVPQGSLCNLNLRFKAGLPPDAVYNIIIDPENRRVFKNIKLTIQGIALKKKISLLPYPRARNSCTRYYSAFQEVVSRKVLLDEGLRQVVEVEQAAIWKFLWWSGILSVHVFVDQNRKDHTVKFKQGRSGFMKKFEGSWKIEPLFVDKEACLPLDPPTLEEYDSCTVGRGRVGSVITLDQLIEPALLPPQPIAWYVRGITARTTEMLVNDLIAETGRLRGLAKNADEKQHIEENSNVNKCLLTGGCGDVKERWRQRRKIGRHGSSLRPTRQ
ncbi:uncharacterized protein LOC100824540 isoform X2 [Brachypodium distachyon]|uniref:uncharacterized protein LOC100824540 isoform X2 n=1 Tax=Brachypodium distachyon TaxID=15368 RepID=UPI000D0CAB5D|nr:uncharacterized protein LOC100824540 isoform X2 [Brachypodium distachyon]|eukprot:XP_024318964.1 uncharacterized protein LOC100824540 isoform X2 [Brachypodium distachyon]